MNGVEYINRALNLSSLGIYIHAITIAIVLGFSLALLILELIGIRRKDALLLKAAKTISLVILIVFVYGAATGTLVEFGLLQVWSGVLLVAGSFAFIPFYLELIAFVLEAATLIALYYTWGKFRNPWSHWMLTLTYTFAAFLSGALITSVNSWMQAPWGVGDVVKMIYPWAPTYGPLVVNVDFLISLKDALVSASGSVGGGVALVNPEILSTLSAKFGELLNDPWIALKSPYSNQSILHQLLASSSVGVFWAASGFALLILRKKGESEYYFKAVKTLAAIGAVLVLAQGATAHWMGAVVYEYQPTKFALIAGLDVSKPDPIVGLTMFGDPNYIFDGFDKLVEAAKNHPNPNLIIGGVSAAEIAVADTVAASKNMNLVYPMYTTKVAVAGLSLLISLAILSIFVFRRFWEGRRSLLVYLALTMGLFTPLMSGLGWAVREIGRKPWTVYGLVYPHEIITPLGGSTWVATVVIGGLVVGFILMCLTIYLALTRRLKIGGK
ncbi:MAG: cytochrome ubiquinol oxidase subunit I [Nitrososphaerales archaeon]